MYAFNVHAIAPFVSHAISVFVCLFLLVKNPRSSLHITLALFCLSASLWQWCTGMMFIAQTDELALFWDRIVYVGVNLQWLMHFQFTVLLLKARDQKRWLIAAYALAAFFAVFTPTDLLVHDLYRYAWGCHSMAGPLHHPFVLVSTGFYTKCLYMIFRRLQQSENQIERTRYKYYMIGFAIFVSASLAYLPAYKISIYPFAYWFETIYCVILVHIIVKYRMLDIETVIHKTLLWLAVSLAMFVPVALVLYFAYPLVSTLGVYPFIGLGAALVGVSIVHYSVVQPRIDHVFQRTKYDFQRVVERFMTSVVTLNDLNKLADVTRDTLRQAIYSENVRCFWIVDNVLVEAGALTNEPMRIELDFALRVHLVAHNELVERDQFAENPAHRAVAAQFEVVFEETNCQLLLPIVHDNYVRGLITLDKKTNLKPYTDLERKFLHDVSVGVSVAVINSLMFETQRKLYDQERAAHRAQQELVRVKDEMNQNLEHKVSERTEALSLAIHKLDATNRDLEAAKNALWGEMELAAKIQSILLPRRPCLRGYEVCAYTKPATEVGGDFYDTINSVGGDWLVIGDVSGHGVKAGLVMMMVQTAIRSVLEQDSRVTPKRLLSIVNECLLNNMQQMQEQQYVSMMVLSARDNGEFLYSGLHHDILVSRVGLPAVEAIESLGVWIGLTSPIDEMTYEGSVTLGVGDVMLLFTDGITEARLASRSSQPTESNPELFGQSRLVRCFADSWRSSVGQVRDRIAGALEDYQCDDDVTFVVVKRVA